MIKMEVNSWKTRNITNPALQDVKSHTKSDKLLEPTYDLLQANGRNTIVSKAISEKLVATYGVEKCVGNAGDIFILNTKNLHWAGKLSAGTRELLWLYY